MYKNDKNNNKGFTLIEILVAVLIVGILAAVSVPMYMRAVERSRTSDPINTLKSVAKAEQVQKLRTGRYTNRTQDLDLELRDYPEGNEVSGDTFEGQFYTYKVYGQNKSAATATRKASDPDDVYELSIEYGSGELFCRPAENKTCIDLGLPEGRVYEQAEGDWTECSSDVSGLASLVGMEGYEDELREELEYIPVCQFQSNQYKICFEEGGEKFCERVKIGRNGCMSAEYCLTNSSYECQGESEYDAWCDNETDLGNGVRLSKSCADFDQEELECNRWQNERLSWYANDGGFNYWSCEADGIAPDGRSCTYYKDYRVTEFVNGEQRDLINCGRWHHGDGVIIDECDVREYDKDGNYLGEGRCFGSNYSDRYDGAAPGSFNSNFTGCDSYAYYSHYSGGYYIYCQNGTCQGYNQDGNFNCTANAQGNGCA